MPTYYSTYVLYMRSSVQKCYGSWKEDKGINENENPKNGRGVKGLMLLLIDCSAPHRLYVIIPLQSPLQRGPACNQLSRVRSIEE